MSIRNIEAWFERLSDLSAVELDQFSSLMLVTIGVERSNAPAASLGGDVVSGAKPHSKPPTSVRPGCSCGCRDEVEHWARVIADAKIADARSGVAGEKIQRAAVRIAYRSLRPNPAAAAAAMETASDRERRILIVYRGWAPEDAAIEEMSLQPWGERPSAFQLRWEADAIRKARKTAKPPLHPETGQDQDSEDEILRRAQQFRNMGLSLRKIGERVGRSHTWVDRNTQAPMAVAA